MPGGTIRDIRTGKAIGHTNSLSETFLLQLKALTESDVDFYVVTGRCRMRDVREVVTQLQGMEGFPILFDPQMPSDTLWIFEGDPAELGFAS